MSGHSVSSDFKNPVVRWIDTRLPVFTMMAKEYGVFPAPRNFNYFWNFGAIALFMLVTMIASGVVLAMNYTPHATLAFGSVERIMRDVNSGWLLRYIHANGASFFFIAVYIHILRGLYYGSYKQPRELLWILGVVILLLMMATAFMGYVLPWGQMSFWGATVITNLFSAIPLVGDSVVTWLWGGFAVDNPTLNRFFALHYLLPFVIFAVVLLHVAALHICGSNNPLGIEPKGPQDTVPFHPYYTAKDTFGLLVFVAIYCMFVFWMPDALGHPDNYTPANPLATPPHIVPEWYFLPFYAILRAVTFDITLPFAQSVALEIGISILGLIVGAVLAFVATYNLPRKFAYQAWGILLALVAGYAATHIGIYFMLWAIGNEQPFTRIMLVEAKLGGVLAMFGAIAVLFVLPWLDTHPVRSARFRPVYQLFYFLLVIACFGLGYAGAHPPEGLPVIIGQVSAVYYFLFFLVITPVLSRVEKARPLPASIADAVLKKSCCAAALLALVLVSAPASASEGSHLMHREWPHHGVTGTFDRAALQRGFQVYKEICASCHSLQLLSYRNLEALGYNEDEVKAIAAQYQVAGEIDDEGNPTERPALPSDRFKSPFANDNAARAANGGALPPDLSLIVKARQGHENFIYSLLTGYGEAPASLTLMQGMNYNATFPGNQIAMPAPLTEGGVTFADGTPATVDQMAADVTQFLAWAGDPHMEERKQTGLKVMIFLVIFASVMYAVKRKVWSDLH